MHFEWINPNYELRPAQKFFIGLMDFFSMLLRVRKTSLA
jgi:hypothetical protein